MCLCIYLFYVSYVIVFFFKQKTAYEMRISDWSSDVCSSDLRDLDTAVVQPLDRVIRAAMALVHLGRLRAHRDAEHLVAKADAEQRLSGVEPLLDHRHRIDAGRGRIAGAVRQEKAVRLVRHDLFTGGGGGQNGHPRDRQSVG